MILEVAVLAVKPGDEVSFVKAYEDVRHVLIAAEDLHSARLTQGIEKPAQFVLIVEWADVAAHERFRDTSEFGRWRDAIAPFASPPQVQHTRDVA